MKKIVYILGVERRSGTNYLNKLLLMHPEVRFSQQPGEDFLLYPSEKLMEYVDGVSKNWCSIWKGMDVETFKQGLQQKLATGLSDYLGETHDEHEYVLTKTPLTNGIENFFTLFPEARLIILVRDGRNVVESGVQSFGWGYEQAAKQWNKSVLRIKSLRDKHPNNPRVFLLKYEDLYANPQQQLESVFGQFEMDDSQFPYHKVEKTPIMGSSTSDSEKGKVDWSAKTDAKSFNPNNRYHSWGADLKFMYDKLCREGAEYLGYDLFNLELNESELTHKA